jgi:hypothetical protein
MQIHLRGHATAAFARPIRRQCLGSTSLARHGWGPRAPRHATATPGVARPDLSKERGLGRSWAGSLRRAALDWAAVWLGLRKAPHGGP